MERSEFISNLIALSTAPYLSQSLESLYDTYLNTFLYEFSTEWEEIINLFHKDETCIDFRSHAASPIPKTALKSFISEYSEIQSFPSYKNKGFKSGDEDELRKSIAKSIHASTSEIAFMRNTTEALNNVIMGLNLQEGDEVLASVHEYDSMMACFYQREQRDQLKIKQLEIPFNPSSPEEIIDIFQKNITDKTRVFLISHMIWISGQIYPIKKLCELARENGIITVIDAAQSYSHVNIDVNDIGCDYLGASLHKWAAGPLGTGFLYINQSRISETYPLLSHYSLPHDSDHIEKFENFGTITPIFRPALVSLKLWEKMGIHKKSNRMHELKTYWTDALNDLSKVNILTNCDSENSCGLAYFEVNGKSSRYIADRLWKNHHILTHVVENYKNQFVDYKGINAIGLATPVFISKKEIDQFITALHKELKQN